MNQYTFSMQAPAAFDFFSAATSYGWVDLLPTRWLPNQQAIERVERLSSSHCVTINISWKNQLLCISIQFFHDELSVDEQKEIQHKVFTMLRLGQDLSDFYKLYKELGRNYKCILGKGYLMRSPSVFEDLVKTICTTNTTWSGTKRMITNLVSSLGESIYPQSEMKSFPSPNKIAHPDSNLIIETLGLGYRASYIKELAVRIVEGELNVEGFLDERITTDALRKNLLQIKGVGPYAANTMLMLLGRYENLAIDSELRDFVLQKHFPSKNRVTDKEILSVYEPWGKWKYLAYWFEEDCS